MVAFCFGVILALGNTHSLKNGLIVRRPKQDHFERIVEIDCTAKEAKALLDLAKQLYPPVVPDIEKPIAAPRGSYVWS